MRFRDHLQRVVNIITLEEKWDESTKQIVDRIIDELGEPETIFTLEGEKVQAYVVKRSRS